MSRHYRDLTDREVGALYDRAGQFVAAQQTPDNPRMRIADEPDCEHGLDTLIIPIREMGKIRLGVFHDRLRQDFGVKADIMADPEAVGGSTRWFLELPTTIEEYASSSSEEDGYSSSSSSSHNRASLALTKPSRERAMFLCFVDALLVLFIWHRIVTGVSGL